MKILGKSLQLVSAGGGFFVGYLWAVLRWTEGQGPTGDLLVRSSVMAGIGVSVLYSILLGGLFWALVPNPRLTGLRVVVSPAVFTVSFAIGAMGMQGALWMLG